MPYLIEDPSGQQAIMLHIPKTGGTLCRLAMRSAGLKARRAGQQHGPWVPKEHQHLPRFTILRHPVTWLESYWGYGTATRWRPRKDEPCWDLHKCHSETFLGFIETYLRRMPGEVGRVFEMFLGGCGYLGRTETMAADLVNILTMIGLEHNPDIVRQHPRENVSNVRGEAAPHVAEWIEKAEPRAMKLWRGLP